MSASRPAPTEPAQEFFRRCWEFARDAREIEGSDVQDWAYELGLLVKVTAEKPCGDGCVCEEIVGADFPTDCYRPVDFGGSRAAGAAPDYSVAAETAAGAIRNALQILQGYRDGAPLDLGAVTRLLRGTLSSLEGGKA